MKSKSKKINFEKKLEKIRELIGQTVVFTVGMAKPNKYDLLDIKVILDEEVPEKCVQEVKAINKDKKIYKELMYIG